MIELKSGKPNQSHKKDQGFVLILFVLSVAASVTILFTVLSLYMYPWLEVTKEQNDRLHARSDLVLCKDLLVRNISANFYLDEHLAPGDEYFKEEGMVCLFESSVEASTSLLQKAFPPDTYTRILAQYPLTAGYAKFRMITMVSKNVGGVERRAHAFIYSDLFTLEEVQSFLFI